MVSKKVEIVNAEGMHMRPAGLIAKAVKAHPDSEVILKAEGKDIKAKAVMQIMAAGLKKGTEVEIVVNGGDEQAVLDEIVAMFEDGFGE
ncbi:MAG: HPr family phosphocarrier protein [Ruminococcus sp.]|uniref:HPr family phosphocarrier protein n=1 Tax=Ruminococcus sp. TaxID=41978 RepID=UPI0026010A22|nr:HPr family phosphocarrier protein [Ruminococcus sp.]MCR5541457.1 HPr family phosphocarrier protein [Ruminococcus sp.]